MSSRMISSNLKPDIIFYKMISTLLLYAIGLFLTINEAIKCLCDTVKNDKMAAVDRDQWQFFNQNKCKNSEKRWWILNFWKKLFIKMRCFGF